MVDMTAESCARALLHGWKSRLACPGASCRIVAGNLNPTSGYLSFFFSGNETSNVLFPHKTTVCVYLMYRMHYNQATHVYVRHDAVKSLLQRPYNGPFLVIQRNDKFFTHNKNGCRDAVSIVRLKPGRPSTQANHTSHDTCSSRYN